jgi:hypothetical protein
VEGMNHHNHQALVLKRTCFASLYLNPYKSVKRILIARLGVGIDRVPNAFVPFIGSSARIERCPRPSTPGHAEETVVPIFGVPNQLNPLVPFKMIRDEIPNVLKQRPVQENNYWTSDFQSLTTKYHWNCLLQKYTKKKRKQEKGD